MATAIVGLQWGDEGKGKITHLLARDAEMVVRFNGGPNAGHTVIDRGVKFGTHLIPAGAFYPNTVSVLAGGMVIDFDVLRQEWESLTEHLGWAPALLISETAHVILPYHRLLEELEGTGRQFGTTRRGIAPAYSDKAAKIGLRAGDLLRPESARNRLARRIEMLKRSWPQVADVQGLDADQLLDDLMASAGPLRSFIGPTTEELRVAVAEGRAVLFEGAQGALLDVDHGTYPFVTSSATTASGLAQSVGMAPAALEHCLGVFKAYLTRVGEGPFPTRVSGAVEDRLRSTGGEFGVTTGRPRDCGWLDMVALRYAVALNGCTRLAITKLDVLSGFNEVPICTSYLRDGSVLRAFPPDADALASCEPQYTVLPGWQDEIGAVRSFDALPEAVRKYIEFIETSVEVPVTVVSVGPGPEETIHRGPAVL